MMLSNEVPVNPEIWLTREVADLLDALCDDREIGRSEVVATLIIEAYGRIGMTPTAMAAFVAESVADLSTVSEPIYEQAQGMRAKMERDGWSPTMAETVSGTWLTGAIVAMWQGMGRS